MDQIIYPISMNREDLSKITIQHLINMLLGQKLKTMSAKSAGPVDQTVSVKPTGPVFKPKSLVQLAAEKLEHSVKQPAILLKQSDKIPTVKTLAANAMVKDKIKYVENLSNKQVSTIMLDKKAVSLQDLRDEELSTQRVSKYMKDSSFQNLFRNRLDNMPGRREKVQITIKAEIEHTLGNRTELKDKTYGPFKMEVPKLSKPDMYKCLMYTLHQNNFTVLSTETISELGATITRHTKLVPLNQTHSS